MGIKVKATAKKGVISVKSLLSHEMSTFNMMEKKTGNREDANFITHVTAKVGDKVVYEASTSQFLSKNPILKFKFKGDFKKGDKVVMSWVDRKGGKDSGKGTIK